MQPLMVASVGYVMWRRMRTCLLRCEQEDTLVTRLNGYGDTETERLGEKDTDMRTGYKSCRVTVRWPAKKAGLRGSTRCVKLTRSRASALMPRHLPAYDQVSTFSIRGELGTLKWPAETQISHDSGIWGTRFEMWRFESMRTDRRNSNPGPAAPRRARAGCRRSHAGTHGAGARRRRSACSHQATAPASPRSQLWSRRNPTAPCRV